MENKILTKELLNEEKYEQLLKLARKKHNKTLKYIQMNLFEDINSPLRWYAIEAIGRLAREMAPKEPEVYRNLIRRFLWAMNDESGNVPWSSPEGIASIIANQPFLFADFTPMLITNALDNPMCHRGMLWAAGRIGGIKSALVEPFINEIHPFISSSTPDLRGFAAWALGEIGYREILSELQLLNDDNRSVLIFKGGKLSQETVGTLAQEAINKLQKVS
ncbi:MAG: DVU0298 family protein [Peptococcales bacterium]|jgi:hypothetical protein